jgi:hypothetical protein
LRILVQAYVAWKVEADEDHVRRYLRAVRNQPAEAASQIRTFLGSALETTVSSFELASLINTDPGRVEIATPCIQRGVHTRLTLINCATAHRNRRRLLRALAEAIGAFLFRDLVTGKEQ